jgi:FkbM family methyltransferase
MSRLDQAVGLARSLAIYHAIPLRQWRMRRLYAQFIEPGDLVFDIGAHIGNRARAFHALACRIVAVEPQPALAHLLRSGFALRGRVEVVEVAVGETEGVVELLISDRTPTVTTAIPVWLQARQQGPDFAQVDWNRSIQVRLTTLDELIRHHGLPSFIKIDVEGAEAAVLAGLDYTVPALSFGYLPRALDLVRSCANRLSVLGYYRFNWSPGESYRLASRHWLSIEELLAGLSNPAVRVSGDVYAVLDTRLRTLASMRQ